LRALLKMGAPSGCHPPARVPLAISDAYTNPVRRVTLFSTNAARRTALFAVSAPDICGLRQLAISGPGILAPSHST
jgi:hypothetical protein